MIKSSYIIFGDSFTFPEGNAATNRVYTYAKGFAGNGIRVHVICFRNDYLKNSSGGDQGIWYYYPYNQKARSSYFILRRWHSLRKYHNTYLLFRKIKRESEIQAVIVYTTRLTVHKFAWVLSRLFRARLIKECSEHPLRLYRKNLFKRAEGTAKFTIETWLCDGVICISRFLVDFYRSRQFSENRLLMIPSTVDTERFSGVAQNPLPYSYIGYFGALTFKRDNVDVLIKAFSGISIQHPGLHLVLGGPCTEQENKMIRDLINELDITSAVTLLEYMSREEITKYITGSDILIMVRSKDMESQASFPSKLTEYLATSKPVITVNVGEISEYLTDGENAFIVEPENPDLLAEKIDHVLNNYNHAIVVARRGKQLTETVFNYTFQAKRIIKFLDAL